MRGLVFGLVGLGLASGAAAQTVRVALVAASEDAPVVLESTLAVNGRLHGRVRIRNVSDRPIASVTLALTIGSPAVDAAVFRRTETIAVNLAPRAAADVDLVGIPERLVLALLPSARARDVELAVLAATVDTGEGWHVRATSPWLGRMDRRGPLQCLDSADGVHQVGDIVVVATVLRRCAADGQMRRAGE